MPDAKATKNVMPKTKTNTAGLKPNVIQGGIPRGATTRANRSRENLVSTSPTTAPPNASTRVSLKSWRSTQLRDAPNAVRTASSLPRARVRENCRFATLAHAMSSTPNTAVNIVYNRPFVSSSMKASIHTSVIG